MSKLFASNRMIVHWVINILMFTIEQIKAAHNKLKSGSDFPAYFQELKF
jgi:hypothetical protein